ncbi:MAG: N-acetyltransferase family protein [Candidatus Limnocylindrales bacterium]
MPDRVLDGLSVARRAERWTTIIAAQEADPGQDVRVWVVERARLVVGFVATGRSRDDDTDPGTGEVRAIYVAPEAWSTGLGAALLRAAVTDLHGRGYAPLILWVLQANRRARRFYERDGWREDGAQRPIDFDGVPVDEVRYRLAGPIHLGTAADHARVPSRP